MKFESKYSIGEKFILTGCPCVIVSVTFTKDGMESYKLQWASPFGEHNAYMTRDELDNCIKINDLLIKENSKRNSKESLEIYDRIWKEWSETLMN